MRAALALLALSTAWGACGPHEPARPIVAHDNPIGFQPSRYRDACVVALSCLANSKATVSACATERSELKSTNPADLVYRQAALSDDEVSCLLAAKGDCDAAAACVGAKPDAPACAASDATCQDSVARGCHLGLGIETSEQCASGTHCGPCGRKGTCCSSACSTPNRCDGERPTRCEMHLNSEPISCTDYGMRCSEHPTAVPDCVGTGSACAPNFAAHCEGAVLVACYSGRSQEIDCAQQGMVCATWSDGQGQSSARCVHRSNDCVEGRNLEACTGSALHFCDAGEAAEIDCTKLGFATCATGPDERALCTR